jgi:hypothetical protein
VTGRRRTMIVSSMLSCCMIPAWILLSTEKGLSVSGFFIQFFVQGAWGVVPIHLNELSPVAYRSTFPGVTYQIGNMLSSPSAQIVNALAEKIYVNDTGGPHVKGYGPVMAIATLIIAILIATTAAFGPERKGRDFSAPLAGAGAGAGAGVSSLDDNMSVEISDKSALDKKGPTALDEEVIDEDSNKHNLSVEAANKNSW